MSNPVAPPPSEDPALGHAYLPPVPEERPSLRPKLLKALAVVVGLAIVLTVKIVFFGDAARVAEVGDCVAASQDISGQGVTEAEAKVVDCGSAEAALVVVGKVAGVSDVHSEACDQFFKEGDRFFVYASESSTGEFLLCLRSRT